MLEIKTAVQSPPSSIQFAKDSKYEEAWIINVDAAEPSQEQIQSYIAKEPYEELIVEFIWNPDDDSARYVLTVCQDKSFLITGGVEFIQTSLELFFSKHDFNELIADINHKLIGRDELFAVKPNLVRLGVFNHWFSVGPIDLWAAGETLDEKAIKQRLAARPEVIRSKLNYQALAFIYNYGDDAKVYHVFKTPCCRKVGDEWIVDESLVWSTIQEFVL